MTKKNPLLARDTHVDAFHGTVTMQKTRAFVTTAANTANNSQVCVELNARGSRLLSELLTSSAEDVDAVETFLAQLHESTTVRDEMLSPEEAAALLGVSRPTVVRWMREGLLTDQPVGSHHKVDRSEVLNLKAHRREQATQRREAAVAQREAAEAAGHDLEVAPTPAELVEAGVALRTGDRAKAEAIFARQRRADARKSAAAAVEPDITDARS